MFGLMSQSNLSTWFVYTYLDNTRKKWDGSVRNIKRAKYLSTSYVITNFVFFGRWGGDESKKKLFVEGFPNFPLRWTIFRFGDAGNH